VISQSFGEGESCADPAILKAEHEVFELLPRKISLSLLPLVIVVLPSQAAIAIAISSALLLRQRFPGYWRWWYFSGC